MNFETYPFQKLNNLLENITPNQNYSSINLSIGEPQFETPKFILDELKNKAHLLNKYPKSSGEDVLRKSILIYLKNRFLLSLKDSEIIPTFGTREVLFNFPQFLLNDIKDSTIIFSNPFYQIYEGSAKVTNSKVIYLNLNEKNSFQPEIEENILEKVNLVILNSPNNPTSSTIPIKNLIKWVELALKYNFILLNDECYIDIYLNNKIPSLLNASIQYGNKNFKNILVVNSISKRSSAPSLRSGFIAGDSKILAEYMEYRTYLGTASPLPLQFAAAKAWSNQSHVDIFRKKYIKNFELAKDILNIKLPLATFYIWLKVDDDLEFTKKLYRNVNIKVMAGSFFGRKGEGKNFIRVALVYDSDIMKNTFILIKKYL